MYQDRIYSLAQLDRFIGPSIKLLRASSSSLCADSLELFVGQVEPRIRKLRISLQGCVLFKATVNALCLELEGKTKEEALKIISNYLLLVQNKEYDPKYLGEHLSVLIPFKLALNRKNCLSIGALKFQEFLLSN